MKVMKYLVPALFLALAGLGACKKTNGPCDAVITVVDSLGKRVQGASVVLRQDSVINPTNGTQAVINETKITNGSGQASFSFKLEAVLNIEADKGSLSARDYIRLEQGEQVAKTVVLR
jgi:hypothetical protein